MREGRRGDGVKTTFLGQFNDTGDIVRDQPEHVEHVLGLLYDALGRLDQAESELRHHPKSRWYWWELCVLKMRLGEYLHVLRIACLLQKHPITRRIIPHHIHRYHRWEVFSDIDTKMIRDPFRLSRLLASQECIVICEVLYHNLHPRIWLQPKGPHVARFLHNANKITALIERAHASLRLHPNRSITKELKSYVDKCCSRAARLIEIVNPGQSSKKPAT